MAYDTVTLAKDATSITLPAPVTSRVRASKKYQAMGKTETGTVYVYSSNVSNYEVELGFEGLTDSEKDDLVSFFEDTVGITETFTYTDPGGTTHTARFIEPTLSLEKVSDNYWNVEFPVELTTFED